MIPDDMILDLEFRYAWWWWPYYYGLITMVLITGLEPDLDKFLRWYARAVRFRFVGAREWRRILG